MSAQRQLKDLADRKRLLVLQADLHRAVLRAECATVRTRLSWLHETRAKMHSVGPWLALSAAMLGLLAAWRGRKLAGWIPAALAAWRAIRTIKSG